MYEIDSEKRASNTIKKDEPGKNENRMEEVRPTPALKKVKPQHRSFTFFLFYYRSSLTVRMVGMRNDHTLYTTADGLEGILEFGNHATGDDALRCEGLEVRFCDVSDYAVLIVSVAQHAPFLKAERQCDIIIRR